MFKRIAALAALIISQQSAIAAPPYEPCMPTQAAGIGTNLASVNYPDDKLVIYTYYCNGQATYVIGLYDFKPVWPAPKGAKEFAVELKRLYVMQGYSNQITPQVREKVEMQLKSYPGPLSPKSGKEKKKVSSIT